MSKRYGRQQKRRARETEAQLRAEVARLESANRVLRTRLHWNEHEVLRLAQAMEDVRRSLGESYYGLPAGEIVRRLSEEYPRPWMDWILPDNPGAPLRMEILRADVVTNDPRLWVGLRLELAGQSYGYAISEAAIYEAPAEYLAEHFARMAARQLVEKLRTKGRARYARF